MSGSASAARRVWLVAEMLLLFAGLPLLHLAGWLPVPIIPALWIVAVVCFAALMLSRGFDRRVLWNAQALRRNLVRVLAPGLVAVPLLWWTTYAIAPERLFAFPRERPELWALVMLLYPVFSVYPQGIIYRVFLFRRYAPLLPTAASRITVSAIAFALAHIVFMNWIAPPLSLLGGLLFAWTYERTHSALAAGVQHALFGQWIFTVGLGWYFYGGSVGT